MGELREYKCKVLKGSVGNTEYWTEDDWVRHRKYVEELKENANSNARYAAFIIYVQRNEGHDRERNAFERRKKKFVLVENSAINDDERPRWIVARYG